MNFPKNLGEDTVVITKGNIVDAFWGKSGWGNHARFQIITNDKGKFLNFQFGKQVPPQAMHSVFKKVGV